MSTWTRGVMKEDGSPLFSFDTDSTDFARGFEAGQLFFRLAVQPTAFQLPISVENRLMVQRMATALEREVHLEEISDELFLVHAEPKGLRIAQPGSDGPQIDIQLRPPPPEAA